MGTLIYATPDQLANYLAGNALDQVPAPEPPADAALLLRQASTLVGGATRAAVYGTDAATGLPLDTAKREAMAEAACATAAAWSINGVNPLAGRAGSKPVVGAKSGGGVNVTYSLYADDAKARSDLASGDVLVSESLRILDAAGLLSTKVQGWG